MPTMKIDCGGLTLKEVQQLAEELKDIDGVEKVGIPWKTRDHAIPPDRMGYISLGMLQASAAPLHLVVKFGAAGSAFAIGKAATEHICKKIGEAIVDRTWGWMKGQFSGKSEDEVEVTLYALTTNR